MLAGSTQPPKVRRFLVRRFDIVACRTVWSAGRIHLGNKKIKLSVCQLLCLGGLFSSHETTHRFIHLCIRESKGDQSIIIKLHRSPWSVRVEICIACVEFSSSLVSRCHVAVVQLLLLLLLLCRRCFWPKPTLCSTLKYIICIHFPAVTAINCQPKTLFGRLNRKARPRPSQVGTGVSRQTRLVGCVHEFTTGRDGRIY